jgi:CBS domain-containing protein
MKTAIRTLLQGKKQGLCTITPDAHVFDALKLMAEYDVGAVLVTKGEQLVGILSERDYARKVVLHGKASHDITVKEIMTPRVVCVQPDRTVEECMALMTEKHIRHLPVIEKDRIIGIVSERDLIKEVISDQQFMIKQLESYMRSDYPG